MTEGSLPLISDIRTFALDDGPGIRTTIFMKGCPLACLWCHNPETTTPGPEISFNSSRCIVCGDCLRACPHNAIGLDDDCRIRRDRCTACGACADACPTLALKQIGRALPPAELVDRLLPDKTFYDASGGGVRFSGGEPTLYMDYLAAVIKILKKQNISVAIQTSGFFDLAEFETKLLENLDWIYFDLKLFDAAKHRRYTGVDNAGILSNFRKLAKRYPERLIARVPLIPGITTTRNNLESIAGFVRKAGCDRRELLSYFVGGVEKRRLLGKTVPKRLAGLHLHQKADARCRLEFDNYFSRRSTQPKIKCATPAVDRRRDSIHSNI